MSQASLVSMNAMQVLSPFLHLQSILHEGNTLRGESRVESHHESYNPD